MKNGIIYISAILVLSGCINNIKQPNFFTKYDKTFYNLQEGFVIDIDSIIEIHDTVTGYFLKFYNSDTNVPKYFNYEGKLYDNQEVIYFEPKGANFKLSLLNFARTSQKGDIMFSYQWPKYKGRDYMNKPDIKCIFEGRSAKPNCWGRVYKIRMKGLFWFDDLNFDFVFFISEIYGVVGFYKSIVNEGKEIIFLIQGDIIHYGLNFDKPVELFTGAIR